MQLIENLYTLEEPWRTRFLVLIANLATDQHLSCSPSTGQWDGHVPDESEVAAWLAEDTNLQHQVALMLETWGK